MLAHMLHGIEKTSTPETSSDASNSYKSTRRRINEVGGQCQPLRQNFASRRIGELPSRCSRKALLLISNTASKPSRPFAAFCWNRSTVTSSNLFLILAQPPHSAVISARCWNCVFAFGSFVDGEYTQVSRTLSRSDHVMFMEQRVTLRCEGSTYEVS